MILTTSPAEPLEACEDTARLLLSQQVEHEVWIEEPDLGTLHVWACPANEPECVLSGPKTQILQELLNLKPPLSSRTDT